MARNPEWGGLKDHYGPCPSVEEHEDDWCPEDCEDGKIRWGSFYAEDTAECHGCHEDKGVQEFGAQEWFCLDCYVATHKDDCGCDLWNWVYAAA